MIKLRLQVFAKGGSGAPIGGGSSKHVSKYSRGSSGSAGKFASGGNARGNRRAEKGEAVTKVNPEETYEVYRIERDKEVRVTDKDGRGIERTGKQIMDKMVWSPSREAWVSKSKGYRYRIRKKK